MIGRTNAKSGGDHSIPVGTGQHLVTFYDFDGKVLKRERVATGGNATAPDTPIHEYLTFAEWNNPFTNVQSDIDTGAIYNTTDGKTYLFITLTPVTGLAPTLYFAKSSTSLMTIDWGDGTTSTSTTSGNQTIQHTYSTAGDYIITIDNSAGGTWSFQTKSCFQGSYTSIVTRAYLGSNILSIGRAFYSDINLKEISIGLNNSVWGFNSICKSLRFFVHYGGDVGGSFFDSCNSLQGVCLKNNINLTGTFNFSNCNSLTKIILSDSSTTIEKSTFQNCYALKKINCKNVTTVDSVFTNCGQITEMIFLQTIPPALTGANFPNINPICKIYVPDASVEAYKTATNWNNYANYIYPLSQKPQSDE